MSNITRKCLYFTVTQWATTGQLEQFTPRHRQNGDALSVKSLKTTPIPGKISLLLNNHDAAAILNRARDKILFLVQTPLSLTN